MVRYNYCGLQFHYVKLLPNCDKYVIIGFKNNIFRYLTSKRGDTMRRFITALLVLIILVTPAFAAALPDANAFIRSQSKSSLNVIDAIDSSEVGQALSGILLLVYKVGYALAVAICHSQTSPMLNPNKV